MRSTHWIVSFGAAAALLVAAGCGDSTGPGGGAGPEVNEYLLNLPSWSEFAPSEPDQAAAPTDTAMTLPDDTLDVEEIQDDGTVQVVPDVVYACTETPYSLTQNPQQIVMYNPDVEILWPGSLLQGKSHRDGKGALLGLTIAERTPIRVSIPSIPSGQNFREVANPDQASVGAAIGEMVGDATAQGLSTPSTITFKQTVSHSESHFALSVGISGHYLGFSAAASANYSRDASETTITAHFYQRMFEVVVAPPQTPASFFSADFTQEKLQQQVSLGRLGPDNIPVYVSNIVYGRMMMFSISSTANEQEIRGTLQAAYNGIAGGVSASLSAKQQTILQESRISVTSLGGDAEATIAVIRSGDWSQYFTDVAPLSSAAPLSYTFRNLSDGSIATVTEASVYNLRQCTPRVASPGLFQFAPLQSQALGIPTPVRTQFGDINDDGVQDMIWNHAGASNQVIIGLGDAGGTFTMTSAVTHPENPSEGWANYSTLVGDFNGDGDADLAWTHLGAAANKVYLGLGNGDGTFGFPSVRILSTSNWSAYLPHVGDATGDGSDDLFFNALGTSNHTYVGVSDGTSNFTLGPLHTHPNQSWGTYVAHVGDVDGNGRADLIWRSVGRTYFGRSNGDGTLALSSFFDISGFSTAGTVRPVGDVSGDQRTDLIWADTVANGQNRVAVGRSTGSDVTFLTPQTAEYNSTVPLIVRIGDMNGDGKIDLLWNSSGATNRVYVGLGKDDGTFDFTPQNQLHDVSTDWDQFAVYLADVTGDGRADVIWNHPATTNRIYVAISQQQ